MVLDRLASEWGAPLGALEELGRRLGEEAKVILVKPTSLHESQR